MEELDLNKYSCDNKDCSDFGLKSRGNIVITTYYGKNKTPLLRCKTCGKRFSSSRGTPFFHLHLDSKTLGSVITTLAKGKSIRDVAVATGVSKDTAWRVLDRASKHCKSTVDELLIELNLEDHQLEDLWSFIMKSKGIQRPIMNQIKEKKKKPIPKNLTLPLFPVKSKGKSTKTD